jgi:hypothetical protein
MQQENIINMHDAIYIKFKRKLNNVSWWVGRVTYRSGSTFGFTSAIDSNIFLVFIRTKQKIHKVCSKTICRDKCIRNSSCFNFSSNFYFLIKKSLKWRKWVYSIFFYTKVWWKKSLQEINAIIKWKKKRVTYFMYIWHK